MPQKKKDVIMGLEKPVTVPEVQADHELFLQAFESKSQPSCYPLFQRDDYRMYILRDVEDLRISLIYC